MLKPMFHAIKKNGIKLAIKILQKND